MSRRLLSRRKLNRSNSVCFVHAEVVLLYIAAKCKQCAFRSTSIGNILNSVAKYVNSSIRLLTVLKSRVLHEEKEITSKALQITAVIFRGATKQFPVCALASISDETQTVTLLNDIRNKECKQ